MRAEVSSTCPRSLYIFYTLLSRPFSASAFLLQPCRCALPASLTLLASLFNALLALFAPLGLVLQRFTALGLLASLAYPLSVASPGSLCSASLRLLRLHRLRSLCSVSGAPPSAVFGLVPSALLTLPAVCSGLRFRSALRIRQSFPRAMRSSRLLTRSAA